MLLEYVQAKLQCNLLFEAIRSPILRGYFKKFLHFILLKNIYLCYSHENNVTFQYNLPSSRYN